ncbi:hypothetical protein J437_LFUL014720 [Ladona fulva]|uniref:Uncharacterized protein n=1 Tax=Ladona fulva TaxID=123851 RepID=A0A8K0P4E4_LADFU|nr:hypothetical protein J437_LFUL014720 [Ladona fulva]
MTEMGDSQPASETGPTLPQLQSVARISKLPIVESAIGVASGIYGRVKESNRVVSWTLNQAEGVGAAALVPVATRLGTPIQAVDTILGKGIDIVEEKVPAIKLTPQEMLDNTKKMVADGLGLNAISQDSSMTARVVGVGMGVATTGLRSAVAIVEMFLDKNYPNVQPDEETDNTESADENEEDIPEPFKVLLRWQKVTRRMQRVVSNSVKRQRDDIAGFLGRMGEYLKDAHPKVIDKVAMTYAEIAKTVQDKNVSTKDMASRVAYQMTSLAVEILGDVGSGIASLPGGLVARLDDAQKYGLDIVRSLLQLGPKKEAKEESVNGCDSDEKAKQLISRQDKGTSPSPPEQTQEPVPAKEPTPVISETKPTTDEKAPAKKVEPAGKKSAS